MRRLRPPVSALVLVVAAALSSCSAGDSSTPESEESGSEGSSSTAPTASAAPGDDRPAAQVLEEAVDATLDTRAFTVDGRLTLSFDDQDLALTSSGSVDYGKVVADVEIGVSEAGQTTQIQVLADGTTLWVRPDGPKAPALPAGLTWVQGDADRLASSSTFTPVALIGVVIALRGAQEVEQTGTTEVDGVQARTFTTTIGYRDAVAAAGADAAALQRALSLTGQAATCDLLVETTIGSDDVVRELNLGVDCGRLPVTGGYTLSLSDVGSEVTAPVAPDPADVLTGRRALALLDDLIIA